MNTQVKKGKRAVQLPNGKKVTVSSTPEPWWSKNEGSGHIDPNLLAPDPRQPRSHIRDDELEELIISIGAVGVRQNLVVTPKHLAPWVEVAPEFEDCFFVIVSGHRRREGALANELGAVPIVVRIYKDQEAYDDDAAILNTGHADLSPLEWGWVIVRMLRDNKNMAVVARKLGRSHPWTTGRYALTRLAPDIQEQLSPELPYKSRLPTGVGSALGKVEVPTTEELAELMSSQQISVELEAVSIEELDENGRRFHLQRVLLEQAGSSTDSAAKITRYINDKVLTLESYRSGGVNRKIREVKPSRRRDQLDSLMNQIHNSTPFTWSDEVMSQILHNADPADLSALGDRLGVVIARLIDMHTVVTSTSEKKKQRFSAVSKMLRADFRSSNGEIIRNGFIPSIARYVELYENGNLGFQIDGSPKPPNLPSIEEARAQMAAQA